MTEKLDVENVNVNVNSVLNFTMMAFNQSFDMALMFQSTETTSITSTSQSLPTYISESMPVESSSLISHVFHTTTVQPYYWDTVDSTPLGDTTETTSILGITSSLSYTFTDSENVIIPQYAGKMYCSTEEKDLTYTIVFKGATSWRNLQTIPFSLQSTSATLNQIILDKSLVVYPAPTPFEVNYELEILI